ncbi:MAG TPA: EamA family transporter RarD [Microbacteriaceae bacterium]|nr:EamA family transporter RarD [Microbacteriaceae bacterium]
MPHSSYSMSRGTLVSVLSAVMFGVIYFLTPSLSPLEGVQVWAIRIIVSIPIVALILIAMRQTNLFTDIFKRVRKNPWLILALALSGSLLTLQLWIFGWAPLNGRGLQVALGYFLLPLVLVLVGRFLYKDQLKWWHWAAAGVAAIGVGYQTVVMGGVSWETLVVCLGYPVYFVLRRSLHTASTGGMLWDLLMLSPVAVIVLIIELTRGDAFTVNPALWWFAPTVSLLAAIALWLYVLASRLLPISIFGLLSYLEPALLIVASLLIGERIIANELVTYAAIWIAVLILFVGGITDFFRSRGFRI